MSGTRVLCLTPVSHVWHLCCKSGTNARAAVNYFSTCRKLCLAPIIYVWNQCKKLENLTVLVANNVWHQWFMSGTSAGSLTKIYREKWFSARLTEHGWFHIWHQFFMSGTSVECMTPLLQLWHQYKRRWKLFQYLSQIMSGTNNLCLEPMQEARKSYSTCRK